MGHHFKKQFGQNFLKHSRFAKELVKAAAIEPGDTVIEIGPGDGKVTRELLDLNCKVIAVEVDYDLVVSLIRQFNDRPGFEIVHQDVLKVDMRELQDKFSFGKEFKVIGALPYNISKQIIAKFIQLDELPTNMAFIVQEEVASVYAAAAPKASYLSNWLGKRASVKKGLSIPNTQFFPVPKVNGAIISITPKPDEAAKTTPEFDRLLRVGFSNPRKTLRNNLAAISSLSKEKIDSALAKMSIEKQRASELSPAQWEELHKSLDF